MKTKKARLPASQGSILAYSLIILAMMTIIAVSLSTTSAISKKSASSTDSSTQSLQTADSGAQLAAKKIKDKFADEPTAKIDEVFDNCTDSDGKAQVTEDITGAGNYTVSFFDKTGAQITTCSFFARKVVDIKSEGTFNNTARAVSVKLPAMRIAPNSDIVLVLDYSDSISTADFQIEKNAAKDFIDKLFESSTSEYQVGVVIFATTVQHYGLSNDKVAIKEFIDNALRDIDGDTDTGAAIDKATDISLNDSNSRRNSPSANPQVMMLVTDGVPWLLNDHPSCDNSGWNDSPLINSVEANSDTAKNNAINIFTISIGFDHLSSPQCEANATELLMGMASLTDYYTPIAEFGDLKAILDGFTID